MADAARMRMDAAAFVGLMSAGLVIALVGPVVGSAATGPAYGSTAGATATGGGTPGPLRSGGAAFGSAIPRPDARPVARGLTLTPRTVVAGRTLPQIRFRVRQHGISRVRARVVVVRLPSRGPVARMVLGWVKPGRPVNVRWPGNVRLRTGRYVVRLHVKDSRGHTLRRSARYPGRAQIVVHAPKAPPPPPGPGRGPGARPGRPPPPRAGPRPRGRPSPPPPRHPPGPGCFPSVVGSTSAAPTRASAPAARATSTRARTSSPRPGRPS